MHILHGRSIAVSASIGIDPAETNRRPFMDPTCEHIPTHTAAAVRAPLDGCAECLAAGTHDWVHLRVCQQCGHIGCCDSSPGKPATSHYVFSGHLVVTSNEPGEDWWWCYADHHLAEVPGSQSAPSRPDRDD